jgi:peptidoglycan/LPS O-acetylase OafA/YrhL
MATTHDQRLQSLRGLAALMVLVGHSRELLDYSLGYPLLPMLLGQQNSAVLFFYVLSGYVLGQSLRRGFDESAPFASLISFAVKRLFRLLPVFWLAILLGAGTFLVIRHAPIAGVSSWFGANFRGADAVAPDYLISNFLGQTVSMNGSLWSVQIEIFIIPLLPPLVVLSRRLPLWADVAMLAVLGAVAFMFMLNPCCMGRPINVGPYLYFFYLGITLPKLMAARPALAASGLLLGVALATCAFLQTSYPAFGLNWTGTLLLDGSVAGLVIAFVLSNPQSGTARLLTWRPLVLLGDVSYSFYAYGNCILLLVAFAIVTSVPPELLVTAPAALIMLAAGVLAFLVNFPLAYLSWRLVERPTTAWGRQFSGRLGRAIALGANAAVGGRAVGVAREVGVAGRVRED